MYAILKVAGHQYKVREGELVRVDKLGVEKGAEVVFQEVLLLGKDGQVTIGAPLVKNARVTGVLEEHAKGEKTISLRRIWTNSIRFRKGHRTQYSMVRIKKIESG